MTPVPEHHESPTTHYNQMIDCVYSVTHLIRRVVMDVPQRDVNSTDVV